MVDAISLVLLRNSNISVFRRETLDGAEYLVAPVTMIVPGVLPGSDGPLLYTANENRKEVTAWNGMPLTRNHPVMNGKNVSARSPKVLQQYSFGMVLNARVLPSGILAAEAWIDVARAGRKFPSLIQRIERGEPIEISTGLFTRKQPAPRGATFNGKSYNFFAMDYRPDHLAVLDGEVGACSITDGCGLGVVSNCKETKKPGPCKGQKKGVGKVAPVKAAPVKAKAAPATAPPSAEGGVPKKKVPNGLVELPTEKKTEKAPEKRSEGDGVTGIPIPKTAKERIAEHKRLAFEHEKITKILSTPEKWKKEDLDVVRERLKVIEKRSNAIADHHNAHNPVPVHPKAPPVPPSGIAPSSRTKTKKPQAPKVEVKKPEAPKVEEKKPEDKKPEAALADVPKRPSLMEKIGKGINEVGFRAKEAAKGVVKMTGATAMVGLAATMGPFEHVIGLSDPFFEAAGNLGTSAKKSFKKAFTGTRNKRKSTLQLLRKMSRS